METNYEKKEEKKCNKGFPHSCGGQMAGFSFWEQWKNLLNLVQANMSLGSLQGIFYREITTFYRSPVLNSRVLSGTLAAILTLCSKLSTLARLSCLFLSMFVLLILTVVLFREPAKLQFPVSLVKQCIQRLMETA